MFAYASYAQKIITNYNILVSQTTKY